MNTLAALGTLGGVAVLGIGEGLRFVSAYVVAGGKEIGRPTHCNDFTALIRLGSEFVGDFALLIALPAAVASAVGAGMVTISALILTGHSSYAAITGVAIGALAAMRCMYTVITR